MSRNHGSMNNHVDAVPLKSHTSNLANTSSLKKARYGCICASNDAGIADFAMAHRMGGELKHEETTSGKETRMARKKKRPSYGAGCVLQVGSGLAIRWRESAFDSDGTIKKVLRYK